MSLNNTLLKNVIISYHEIYMVSSNRHELTSFCGIRFSEKFWRVPPKRGRQTRVGWGKQAIFLLYASISRER